MFANSIERNLFGFLPGRKAVDHLVVGAWTSEVVELDIDDLGNLALGDLPPVRDRDARHIRKHPIAGRARLLHRQLGQDIFARHDQAELLAQLRAAQYRASSHLRDHVCRRESDLAAMHAAGIAQDHDDMQLASLRAINRNEHRGIDHSHSSSSALLLQCGRPRKDAISNNCIVGSEYDKAVGRERKLHGQEPKLSFDHHRSASRRSSRLLRQSESSKRRTSIGSRENGHPL